MTGPHGLAIEAATARLSLAAMAGERRTVLDLEPARAHTDRIYGHAARLLDDVGSCFDRLDFVAFGCGPGSFTGVRIAAAVAQAVAFARNLPVCRVSSLAVLAAAARGTGAAACGICIDARMGQAYAALYETGPQVRPILADVLVDPAAFTMPGSAPFAAVGDGWQAFAGIRGRHHARVLSWHPHLLPSAGDLLSMALADFRAGRVVSAREAFPEYLGQAPARPAANGGED